MTKYIFNKMIYEIKDTIGNVLFVSLIVSIATVCCHITYKLAEIVKEEWYKNSIKMQSVQDPFIREKMDSIIWLMIALIIIIFAFCYILYCLKLKLDIQKECRRISIYQILGYSTFHRAGSLYLGKLVELVISLIPANFFSYLIWKGLTKNAVFYQIITLMDKDMNYQFKYSIINLFILALFGFITILWMVARKLKITDLKGEENE